MNSSHTSIITRIGNQIIRRVTLAFTMPPIPHQPRPYNPLKEIIDYDDMLNEEEQPPTVDDYNHVVAIARYAYRNS